MARWYLYQRGKPCKAALHDPVFKEMLCPLNGDTYAIPEAKDLEEVKGRGATEYGSTIVGGDEASKIDAKTGKHKK